MTEEKIAKLNDIAEMLPEVSKAKTNAHTGYINAQAALKIENLKIELIKNFSEYIYKNISDLNKFLFIFENS